MVRPLTNQEKCFAELVVENERNKKLFEMACEEIVSKESCLTCNLDSEYNFCSYDEYKKCDLGNNTKIHCWQKNFEEKLEEG